jgi:hypothetical protein
VQGDASKVNYTLNRHNYDMGYYLFDGIYPNWATFVKTIKAPTSLKVTHFTTAQEAKQKDVERAFGVLQARFQIVRQPAQLWDEVVLRHIMTACIILHNMIIEDGQDLGLGGGNESKNRVQGSGREKKGAPPTFGDGQLKMKFHGQLEYGRQRMRPGMRWQQICPLDT